MHTVDIVPVTKQKFPRKSVGSHFLVVVFPNLMHSEMWAWLAVFVMNMLAVCSILSVAK